MLRALVCKATCVRIWKKRVRNYWLFSYRFKLPIMLLLGLNYDTSMLVQSVVKSNQADTRLRKSETDHWLMKWQTHHILLPTENHGIHGTQVCLRFAFLILTLLKLSPFNFSFITGWTEGCWDLTRRCVHQTIHDRNLAWFVLLWNHHQAPAQPHSDSWHS